MFKEIAWTWYVLIGTLVCLFVGYVVSMLFPQTQNLTGVEETAPAD